MSLVSVGVYLMGNIIRECISVMSYVYYNCHLPVLTKCMCVFLLYM